MTLKIHELMRVMEENTSARKPMCDSVSAGGSAQVTVRSQPQWRGKFFNPAAMRRGRKVAKVASKLALHLY